MKKQISTLQKQLATKEKEAATLRKKIELEEKANKPKLITDRVKTLKDVYKMAKPTKEEWVVLNYAGNSKRLLFAKYYMVLALISEVLNEGHVFSMTDNEYRYFPVFDLRGSGFVFSGSFYGYYHDYTAVGSALSLKNEALADYAGTTFLQDYKNAMLLLPNNFKNQIKK